MRDLIKIGRITDVTENLSKSRNPYTPSRICVSVIAFALVVGLLRGGLLFIDHPYLKRFFMAIAPDRGRRNIRSDFRRLYGRFALLLEDRGGSTQAS